MIPGISLADLNKVPGGISAKSKVGASVMKHIKAKRVKSVVYEPILSENEFFGCRVVKELDAFKKQCNVIVANRYSEELQDV